MEAERKTEASLMVGEGVSLMDLCWHHCRWPLDRVDPDKRLMMYCGKTRLQGSSYCQHHHIVATTASRGLRAVLPPIKLKDAG